MCTLSLDYQQLTFRTTDLLFSCTMFVIEVKDTKNVVQSIVFNISDTNHHVQNIYANPTALQPLIAKLRYTMR